ncbi:MAG: hypothetical protein AAF614_21350, partial [Chloroflexota bacterium]
MSAYSLSFNDKKLRQTLNSLSNNDEEFWSFNGRSYRGQTHGFFQYPAMMVPQMQRVLLNKT